MRRRRRKRLFEEAQKGTVEPFVPTPQKTKHPPPKKEAAEEIEVEETKHKEEVVEEKETAEAEPFEAAEPEEPEVVTEAVEAEAFEQDAAPTQPHEEAEPEEAEPEEAEPFEAAEPEEPEVVTEAVEAEKTEEPPEEPAETEPEQLQPEQVSDESTQILPEQPIAEKKVAAPVKAAPKPIRAIVPIIVREPPPVQQTRPQADEKQEQEEDTAPELATDTAATLSDVKIPVEQEKDETVIPLKDEDICFVEDEVEDEADITLVTSLEHLQKIAAEVTAEKDGGADASETAPEPSSEISEEHVHTDRFATVVTSLEALEDAASADKAKEGGVRYASADFYSREDRWKLKRHKQLILKCFNELRRLNKDDDEDEVFDLTRLCIVLLSVTDGDILRETRSTDSTKSQLDCYKKHSQAVDETYKQLVLAGGDKFLKLLEEYVSLLRMKDKQIVNDGRFWAEDVDDAWGHGWEEVDDAWGHGWEEVDDKILPTTPKASLPPTAVERTKPKLLLPGGNAEEATLEMLPVTKQRAIEHRKKNKPKGGTKKGWVSRIFGGGGDE